MTTQEYTNRIRQLNDVFRDECLFDDVMKTPGIYTLPKETQLDILVAVKVFDAFTLDNDPHGEHDFGSVTVEGLTIFWKIDYYNRDFSAGSEDPSDPNVTHRLMTVMLASEY